MLPYNASAEFGSKFIEDILTYTDLLIRDCSNTGVVKYLPNLRFRIDRVVLVNIAEFSELGLIVNSKQLRFVACNAEPQSWITQLKELIYSFDI